MKSPEELTDRALDECLAHVETTAAGDFRIEPLKPVTEWNPTLQRQVFEQAMVVWRSLGEVEFVLDEHDKVVGLTDHGQLDGCEYAALEERVIFEIVAAAGIATAGYAIAEMGRGEGDSLDVLLRRTVRLESGGTRVETARARINASRQTIIEFVATEETP